MKYQKNKVVLGLSGGVDSTSAALLLKKKGYEVIGFYFDVLGENKEAEEKASRAARELDIPLMNKVVASEFERDVIDVFCKEYEAGRTPNPCVICNPKIKFKYLLEAANEVGAYYIATGHYAKIVNKDDKYFVCQGASEKKDQSYMLGRLGQNVLSRLIFPLGEIENKDETREIARKEGIFNSETPDSMEICFVDENKESYTSFILRKGYENREGNFVDKNGKVLGKHKGLINYTVGQRKGLGMTFGKPMFVLALNAEDNTVVLGDNEDLFTKEIYAIDNFFCETDSNILPARFALPLKVEGKIRYAAKPSSGQIISYENGRLKIKFDEPQRAPTPGQTLAIYKDGLLIGSGFLD